ncbi:hypothetical protein J7T55_013903 [Diaporthe amygdali]|uniref:uncharacterized protein n=1 Tax=Phomopsis amygdali TaxID=1214568 RepID=UPI0022FE40DE|nr:uncharacterized protein J7T55_013903 [Diaporthe amygdali]KAJ0119700.1 hypothetical protein J7T55_013903 [Diaporthe amygdali]
MKLTSIVAAILAGANVAVIAKSCKQGGVYCGQSLLKRGNYHDHIVETLDAEGQSTDDVHIRNSLFDCLSNGDIRYRDYCYKGCGGIDSKDADYCL